MHIGVSAHGFVGWGGGVGFIENLLFGLVAVPDKVTKITVFVPAQRGLRQLAGRVKRAAFQPSQAIRHLWGTTHNPTPWRTAPALFAKICPVVMRYDGTSKSLSQLCQRLKVDVLLPSMTPLRKFGTPWAGYLFDCQHRYYPQFFDSNEIANRDRDFVQMLRTASCVIVNSQAVVTDLDTFFPDKKANISALPFSPLMRSENIRSVLAQTPLVKKKYDAGEQYFIISNQFWIHKDHKTAFKAFALAIQDDALSSYRLVCTGAMEDYRFPGHFSELQALLTSLNIKDRVTFTGYIDKLEQLALLNGADLMLQPTLFEGGPGGGSAYDSVALGVPSVLSDIPVNLEINDSTVTFFKAGDEQSLANAIKWQIQNKARRQSMDELSQKSGDYARKLGLSLFDIASTCAGSGCDLG